jgi:GGDEF domain-containing protein
VHEVNTVAARLDRERWLPARARRKHIPGSELASPAPRMVAVSRLIIACACLTVVAIGLATGIGYRWAWQSDERVTLEQHAALRNAISVLQPSLLKSGDADRRLIRIAEQIAGVKNIRFTSNPDTTDREMQPVVTGDGRIAGFFVWDSSRHMTRAMNRLASVAAVIAFALAGFAAMSLFHLKRAQRELAVREAEAARAADEDKLTGLPNHAKTLELLDLALAEQPDDACTTFALIEIDGMDDVAAQHGVLGSDELIAGVARLLKEALPAHARCGRIATDEFAVILTASPHIDAEAVIRTALESMRVRTGSTVSSE